MRTALATAIVFTLAAHAARAQPAPAPAPAGNAAAADAKIASAKQHYAHAELGAALADLAEAYHLDARPDLLYAMAQIEVELNDCAGAVAHYKQYLSTNPPAKARDATAKAKAACEAKLGVTPTTTEPVKTPPPPPKVIVKEVPRPLETVERPFYKDGLGDGLAVSGVVVGGAGAVLYLLARKDIDSSETAATLGAHDQLVNEAHNLRTYAVIAGSVGGALAVGAIIRWAAHGGGTETRERVSVTIAPSPDGTGWGFAALGRF
jgi:hypothetical protein